MVILIRLQLSFGLSAAQKGQAETFVFHYISRKRQARGWRENEGLQGGEGGRGESQTNGVENVRAIDEKR